MLDIYHVQSSYLFLDYFYFMVSVYEYWLRGNEGDEVVSIIDDNYVNTITLNKTEDLFVTKNSEIRILFTNDNGPRDVFFRSDFPTTIKSLRFNEWKCGLSNEEPQCDEVRNGQFFQSDTYTITFEGKMTKMLNIGDY